MLAIAIGLLASLIIMKKDGKQVAFSRENLNSLRDAIKRAFFVNLKIIDSLMQYVSEVERRSNPFC